MPVTPPERWTSCGHDCSLDNPENAPTFDVFGHNQKRALKHADLGRYFNFGVDRDRWRGLFRSGADQSAATGHEKSELKQLSKQSCRVVLGDTSNAFGRSIS
jgi:hypothetical protein